MGNIINILKKPKVSKVLKYNKVDCIVNNAITFTEQDIEFCYECEKIYILFVIHHCNKCNRCHNKYRNIYCEKCNICIDPYNSDELIRHKKKCILFKK